MYWTGRGGGSVSPSVACVLPSGAELMGRRRHWAGLAAVSAAALGTVHSPRMARAYQVWIDLNTYTEDREGGRGDGREPHDGLGRGRWGLADHRQQLRRQQHGRGRLQVGHRHQHLDRVQHVRVAADHHQHRRAPTPRSAPRTTPTTATPAPGRHPDYESYNDAVTRSSAPAGRRRSSCWTAPSTTRPAALVGGDAAEHGVGVRGELVQHRGRHVRCHPRRAHRRAHPRVHRRHQLGDQHRGPPWPTTAARAAAYGPSRNGSTGFAVTSATFETDRHPKRGRGRLPQVGLQPAVQRQPAAWSARPRTPTSC